MPDDITTRLFDVPAAAKRPSFAGPTGYTAQGAAAEMLLAGELLERGHKVAVPIADDDGVDLIVNYGTKVQVKSSSSREPKNGALVVWLQRSCYRLPGEKTQQRKIQAHVDVVAVFARDTRTWWFIPRDQLTQVKQLRLNEGAQHGLAAWRDAWELFEIPIPTVVSESDAT